MKGILNKIKKISSKSILLISSKHFSIKAMILIALVMSSFQTGFAVVKLDETLKPEYLPNIKAGQGTESSASGYLAFIFQFLSGILLYFAAPIAILMIAIAGLMWVTARGDDGAMEKAKNTLTWAIIGMIVITFSFVIVRAVIQVFFQAENLANS